MSPERAILRDALGIAIASGAYAISFGAISTAAGVSLRFCNNGQFASAASGFVHVLAIHDY